MLTFLSGLYIEAILVRGSSPPPAARNWLRGSLPSKAIESGKTGAVDETELLFVDPLFYKEKKIPKLPQVTNIISKISLI